MASSDATTDNDGVSLRLLSSKKDNNVFDFDDDDPRDAYALHELLGTGSFGAVYKAAFSSARREGDREEEEEEEEEDHHQHQQRLEERKIVAT